jgi:geranylgeranyl pyrophosphate synthase
MRLPPHLQERVEALDRPLRTLFRGREPESLYAPMSYVLEAGGKRIRPLLVTLSCEAAGGRAEDCAHAAEAVELLHTFTLVHDDIMDHDALRRGRPTVHRRWDEATAILAGDGLVTAAYASLLQTRHPSLGTVLGLFTRSLEVLCEGQALDKAFESRDAVTPGEYLDMIGKKTGKLIEACCEIGAVLGGAEGGEAAAFGEFGRALGTAFQIHDDWLDVVSSDEKMGKPACSDIAAKKKTFLSIHFLAEADGARRREFARFWGRPEPAAADADAVRALFAATGTLEAARGAIAEATERALGALGRVRPGRARDDLRTLALALLDRED